MKSKKSGTIPVHSIQGPLHRRTFLKNTGAALGILAFPTIIPSSALGLNGQVAPSNRVQVGIIGTGNQGTNDMGNFLRDDRVQIVSVCDVNRLGPGYWNGSVRGWKYARDMVHKHYSEKLPSGTYKGCSVYEDFRDLLDRDDIDAVEVATPDHWHALITIAAARAGKDIYCQKPLSLTVVEGRAMSNAVQKYNRIFQTGSQQRSDRRFRHACELVRNGRIGKLQRVDCGLPGGRPDFGKNADKKQPEPVPEGFHYDMWLGPAPHAPYAPARVGVNFRWIYDYSGGQVTDWGGHHPDIAQWGMGTEYTGPIRVKNARGVWPKDELWNTATEFYFECEYQNGVLLTVSNEHKQGVRFQGTEGWVYVRRGFIEASNEDLLEEKLGESDVRLYHSDDHFRNFIDCVLTRKEAIAPCEIAHRSITLGHLGNIAMLLGRDIQWDPDKEQVLGDISAQAMLNRPYRAPWQLVV